MSTSNPTATFTGNGTSGIFAWGAQLTPLSFVTDYQVTTATTVPQAWSKSNVTVAKTATGIDGVANAATTVTATAANAVLIQPISLASGSRTSSVYLKRITGTGNVQVTMDGSTWSTVDLSNGLWNRIVLSGTVTNPCVGVLLATNGDAVAMDYGQIEDGAFVTSPILTTTATATRATETTSISITYSMNILSYQSGTAVVNFKPQIIPIFSTGENSIISVGGTNGYFNFYNQTAGRFGLRLLGNNSNLAIAYISALTENIISATWASKIIARSSNLGAFDERSGTATSYPIQSFDRVAALNSTTKRVTYWPVEMTLTAIRTLTGQQT